MRKLESKLPSKNDVYLDESGITVPHFMKSNYSRTSSINQRLDGTQTVTFYKDDSKSALQYPSPKTERYKSKSLLGKTKPKTSRDIPIPTTHLDQTPALPTTDRSPKPLHANSNLKFKQIIHSHETERYKEAKEKLHRKFTTRRRTTPLPPPDTPPHSHPHSPPQSHSPNPPPPLTPDQPQPQPQPPSTKIHLPIVNPIPTKKTPPNPTKDYKFPTKNTGNSMQTSMIVTVKDSPAFTEKNQSPNAGKYKKGKTKICGDLGFVETMSGGH